MAVPSTSLLQLGTANAAGQASSQPLGKTANTTNDAGQSFSDVYAHQQGGNSTSAKTRSIDTAGNVADNKPAASNKVDTKTAKAADNGKDLPAGKARGKDDDTAPKATGPDAKDDKVAASDADDSDEATTAGSDAVAAQPDAATLAAQPPVQPAPTQPDPATLAQQTVATPPVPQPQAAVATAANDDSQAGDLDPAADALEGLPMVRMALEQNAKAQGTTSAHALNENNKGEATDGSTVASSFADQLAAVVEQKTTEGNSGEHSSDLGASNDSDGTQLPGALANTPRAEDFASRLQGLTGTAGATAATNSASAQAQQPLQMQQSGWSEGLVNRVMYLSSQNLKSADIQLHPLELGRLDIRVDVTPDQQTQVTFTSVHPAVREALDSQQGRLRDMLTQQGLSNVDVNVSDQSRQQQQQQQQQHMQQQAMASQRSSNVGGNGELGGSAADLADSAVQGVTQAEIVLGSSVVDYYA